LLTIGRSTMSSSAVLLDLDGTLVDSVYLHVTAWYEAFHEAGVTVPMARIHAGIGMGGDRLMPWLVGHRDDADRISEDHARRFLAQADRLAPTPGARELLEDLARRSVPFVVATSAAQEEREALLTALGRQDLPIVGSDDVASSKPAPDLLLAARDQLDGAPEHIAMVGDAPWDAIAATRAGMEAIGVTCGGFPESTLRRAGASRVAANPADLIGTL
jgi:HAD superfamily hydrolase (TIGR01549 family)